MELKIGVQHAQRELIVEAEESVADLEARLSASLSEGGVLSITDSKGRTVMVPGDKIAYIELDTRSTGTVGFR